VRRHGLDSVEKAMWGGANNGEKVAMKATKKIGRLLFGFWVWGPMIPGITEGQGHGKRKLSGGVKVTRGIGEEHIKKGGRRGP